ncbi:MAG: hypothetical protein HQ478_01725 [Chloroflexi bacterium]|nr:hypothetical protein [Chloroflexota bacterium]
MAQLTVLHPRESSSSIQSEIDEFGRSVIDSVVNRKGLTFSIEVSDESEIANISGRLEKFLLLLSAASGGTMARVAPRFSDDTLPALASLTRELPAGWKAEGERTIRYGRARQVFVSVDRPLQRSGAESRPDRLLEVVSAHQVTADWFQTRVQPRIADQTELTVAYYGVATGGQSLFSEVTEDHLRMESHGDERHHFNAAINADSGWLHYGLPAAV